MGLLFLDPLLLTGWVTALVVGAVVLRGHGPRWFGRDAWWTVACWPLPLVIVLLPLLAGVGTGAGGLLAPLLGDQSLVNAAIYIIGVVGPVSWLLTWPPRWVFPAWARARIVDPPHWTRDGLPPQAVPAVQARRGHASQAAWTWRVDGIAGHVWLDGERVRFRSLDAALPAEDDADLDPAARSGAATGAASDGDGPGVPSPFRGLDEPMGGRWQRGHLDVELHELDAVTRRARRPRRRSGVVGFEVTDRRPQYLWVADADALVDAITAVRDGGTRG
ncbi:MAG: hypothetical protein JJT89_17635 [Nitriliruptoraceae bacterium]|nr:hypothetical protein [Nitriliruptoraceae bacterium]